MDATVIRFSDFEAPKRERQPPEEPAEVITLPVIRIERQEAERQRQWDGVWPFAPDCT